MRYFHFTVLFISTALAIGQNKTIIFSASGGDVALASAGSSVQIVADQGDWPAVLRVADDLALDFGRVTGTNGSVSLANSTSFASLNASMIYNVTHKASFVMPDPHEKGGVIIAGTIGNSSVIDALVSADKIDVSGISGTWEAFVSTVVTNPMPGVATALVIAGSDRRGTIYGLYDISEQIGVSPWYYWADSPPQAHDSIYALNTTKVQPSPSVKYRGFFINDEAPSLTGYVEEYFPNSLWGPGFNADFYHTMFELILRLRANYLWPAQWNSMFNVDDPRSQALADEYGIVMGTSHTEPMMRATKEWTVFGEGPWEWSTNNASIYPFFVEGAERTKPYEAVITMGMRGSGDTALGAGIETTLLENVVATQRAILAQVFGNASISNPDLVPQMWCLYKEVQGYYEAGMTVDPSITLLWTDDNWGNIRRLPRQNETHRSGGAGVYYHFDYVGDPRDYKWINTVQLQKTWEQMHLAYERQADRIWIVNVGDLKPLELPISHFFDLAYDINRWNKDSVPAWLELWASREFGPAVASETASLMNNYSVAVGRRKYELIDPSTFSLINYEEADTILGEWEAMQSVAQKISDSLPAATRPAFFEMVLHPVSAGYVFNQIMIGSARNNLYASQGRTSANALAQHVRDLFALDHELSAQYNTLLDSKWKYMMSQTHIGYTYWQQPMRQALPGLQYVDTWQRDLAGDMGVSVAGSNASVPGDDQYHTLSTDVLYLPPFDPYGSSTRWIDIYAVGSHAFDWNITAAPFIKLSRNNGTISANGTGDVRVYVAIDWLLCPTGSNTTMLNISSSSVDVTGTYGTQYSMPQVAVAYNHTVLPSNFTNGFVETDGHVSIEAEHYSRILPGSANVSYEVIPSLSKTLSGITLFPVTADSLTNRSGPALEYDFYTFSNLSTGVVYPASLLNVTLILGTSLNTLPERPLRYGVQLDEQPIQEVQYIVDQPAGALPLGWTDAVSDEAWMSTTNFTYTEPGLHKLRVWELEPGVVLQKIVVNLGGVRTSYLGPPESYRA